MYISLTPPCTTSFVVQLVYDMISFAISEFTRKKFRFLGSSKSEMRRLMGEVMVVLARCVRSILCYAILILTTNPFNNALTNTPYRIYH